MDYQSAMSELKKAGTAQNVKVYKTHGAGDNLFGVSFANLRALAKKIKTDQPLAEQLWESGNEDARCLATLIADPAVISQKTLDSWARSTEYYVVADLVGSLAARTPFADKLMHKWTAQKKEYVRQIGYVTLSCMLAADHPDLSDNACADMLQTIEAETHGSANRARHAMNMALTAIGIYRPTLTDAALQTAARIGTVSVDHGATSCKTPDAAAYIQKALNRKKTASRRK